MHTIIFAALILNFVSLSYASPFYHPTICATSEIALRIPELSLHDAAYCNDIPTLHEWLTLGYDVNTVCNGETALCVACRQENLAAIEFLLMHGAQANIPNTIGISPLRYACREGAVNVITLLLEYDASILQDHAYQSERQAILEEICKTGNTEAIKILSNYGLSLVEINEHVLEKQKKRTLLHIACEKNDRALAERLIVNRIVSPRAQDHCSETPLHIAAKNGNTAIALLLLDHGADGNAVSNTMYYSDLFCCTPLHIACYQQDSRFTQLLLSHTTINPNSKDSFDKTPLDIAIEKQNRILVRLLSNHKNIDLYTKDITGITPLHRACVYNFFYAVKILCTKMTFVDMFNPSKKETPLMTAVKNGYTNIVELLLKAGADVNVKNCEDNTALHYACIYGHPTIAQILIEMGADVYAKNKQGKIAFDGLPQNQSTDIFLRERIASTLRPYFIIPTEEQENLITQVATIVNRSISPNKAAAWRQEHANNYYAV